MKRTFIWIVVVAALYTAPLFSQPTTSDSKTKARQQMQIFQNTLKLIKINYVHDVDSQDMIYRAIDSMLEELDPHSNFLDAKSAKKLAEDHKGSFGGLGIVITIRNDVLTVSALINDRTPAALAGLLPGDKIVKIEGESTEGITTSEAAKKMRGLIGTKVTVTVKRVGIKETINFTITRGDIPIDTVPYAFMIRPGVGYLRLERFTKKARQEFTQYANQLEKEDMESLILDLRGNPGGYLEQAFAIAEQFIGGNRAAIVKTMGRMPGSSREYTSRRAAPVRSYPVVVLVNEGSASASEIVAGALQDWDRGLVVGENSFGKGLVQRIFHAGTPPYPITACVGCELKLTTARYYTPSGRCIQRPYEGIDSYSYRHPDREELEKDESRPEYKTAGGRTVYGGGGIAPDIEVSLEKMSEISSLLRSRNAFRLFMQHYYENIKPISECESVPTITPNLRDLFLAFVKEKDFVDTIDIAEKEIEEDWGYIDRMLLYELTLEYWSKKGTDYHTARQEAYKIIIELDDQLMKAIELAPNAKELLAQE